MDIPLIIEPGTRADLLADAAAAGHQVTGRMIEDWKHRGLLDRPLKRSLGKGHGTAPALYSSNQRMLFLTLLQLRGQTDSHQTLARVPVFIWMYAGDEHVPLRQARVAFATWLGDPRSSPVQAKASAAGLLAMLENEAATDEARAEFLAVVEHILWAAPARIDTAHLEQVVRAVFEPGSVQVRRALGHPDAPLTTESMMTLILTHNEVTQQLAPHKKFAHQQGRRRIPNEWFEWARREHLQSLDEYNQRQTDYAAAAPQHLTDFYRQGKDWDTLVNNAGHHLRLMLGIRLLNAQAGQRPPA